MRVVGRRRRFRPRAGASVAAGNDARQPIQQLLAGGDATIEFGGEAVGAAQPLAQPRVAFLHGEFQAGDGAFGDFGGRDQLGNRRPQRLFVGLQELEAAVERDAVNDCQREQDRHQHFDNHT